MKEVDYLTEIEAMYIEQFRKNERLAKGRRIRRQQLVDAILETVAVWSVASIGFLGVGALGSWGFEIIENNSNSILQKYDWQAQKNVCLGGIAVAASVFLGSAMTGACVSMAIKNPD